MNNQSGFTLIEVLVALMILSIALIAMIKITSQNIRDNIYLQDKIIANWVGTNVLNEMRVQLQNGTEMGTQETNMLKRKWPWQAQSFSTANPHIKKITVDVFHSANHQRLMHLESFMYVPA